MNLRPDSNNGRDKRASETRDLRALRPKKSSTYFKYACGFFGLQHPESHRVSEARHRHVPAFTLPEVLIVIVIGAILAVMTIPVAIRFYQSQLVSDTALTLKQTLRRAQANAIAARNDSSFGVRIQSADFVLFQGMNYASRIVSEDEHIAYPSTVTVTSTSNEFVFSKMYATSSAGTIALTGPFGGATVNLSVASSGKIDLQ